MMNPDPQFLYQLLITVGFLGAVSVAWMALHNQSKVQKREVTFAEEFATKEEVGSLRQGLDQLHVQHEDRRRAIYSKLEEVRKEIKEDLDKINQQHETRAEKIHSRIDDVMKAVCRIEGRVNND